MRLSFCLVPVTIAATLAGCAQSPLVDNVASSNKRLGQLQQPLPTPVSSFRASDWAIEPQPAAPAVQRTQPATVVAAAPAATPTTSAAPVAITAVSALTYEPVKWMRQANNCDTNEHCAEVSVEYPRFPLDMELTSAIERQMGVVLTGLTQPQLIQPTVSSGSYNVAASVNRYLTDSYSEGFVELSTDVLRADSQLVVLSVNGTLHRVARDVSETQYVLFDRNQRRLIEPSELAQSKGMSHYVAQLLLEGEPNEALSRAAGALLTEEAIEGDDE